jgi:hypothetical protein
MTVDVDPGALRAWPWLPEQAVAGTIWIGPTGERVRILDDGTVEEIGEVPRRWSSSADPCAIRTR